MRGSRGCPALLTPSVQGWLASLVLAGALVVSSSACQPGGGTESASTEGTRPEPVAAATESPPAPRRPLCSDPEIFDRQLDLPSPGEAITLRGSETDALAVATTAGETLEITADQDGIDVYLALFDAEGKRLVATDRPTARLGEERLIWIGESDRSLRLHVCAWGSQSISGTYTLHVQRRPSEPGDDATLTAYHQVEEAKRLMRLGPTRWDDALDAFRLAAAQEVHPSGQFLRTEARYRLARLLQDQQRFEDALEILDALHVEHDHRAFPELALRILNRRARVLNELGKPKQAEDSLLKALEVVESLEDPTLLSRVHYDLGRFYDFSGDVYLAIESYDRSIELRSFDPDEEHLASTLHNRGLSYRTLGKYREAVDDFEQALEIRTRLQLPNSQAQTLETLATALERLDRADEAENALRRALELCEQTGNVVERASVLTSLSSNLFLQQRFEESLAAGLEALPTTLAQGTRLEQGILQHNIGLALNALDRPDEALDRYRLALEDLEPIQDLRATSLTRWAIAEAQYKKGDLASSRLAIAESIRDLETLRNQLGSYDLRASYLATRRVLYDFHVDLLIELYESTSDPRLLEESLAVSETARARSQLDALSDRLQLAQAASLTNLSGFPELSRTINRLEESRTRALEGNADPERQRQIERELRRQLQVYRRAQANAQVLPTVETQILGAPEIQGLLDEDTTLLEFHLGYKQSVLWIVTRSSIRAIDLPRKQEIDRLARRSYRLLAGSYRRRQRVQTHRTLCQLSTAILGNALETVDTRRLVVAAEGGLNYIPFAALPRPEECLSESTWDSPAVLGSTFDVLSIPSASYLDALRQSGKDREPPRREILILADPDFSSISEEQRYEPLAFSRFEASQILEIIDPDQATALYGESANRQDFLAQRPEDYRILHFATHGELNTEHPELSRLVLARRESSGRSPFLFAHEIDDLELRADLVVLSACETALGHEIYGEGMIGLPQAFMVAGSSAVLVSLWKIDDRVTGELMGRFYRNLLQERMPLPRALAEAQLHIRRIRPSPYYWAGFVLKGDWVAMDSSLES